MPHTTRSLPGRLCLILIAWLSATGAAGEVVAITDVNIVSLDDAVPAGVQTVVVEDGLIVAVGDDVDVPADAKHIDGRDRYLMPGLTEMHAHVPNSEAGLDRVLTLFLVNGVTTIRGMLGAPSHLALRRDLARPQTDHIRSVSERQQRLEPGAGAQHGGAPGQRRLRLREAAPGPLDGGIRRHRRRRP